MTETTVLKDFIEEWITLFKDNSVKESSLKRLKQSLRTLESYSIADMPVGDITMFDLQRYINCLVDSGYSMSGLRKQVLIVTAPLRQAAALKIIKADPCVGIKFPKEVKLRKHKRDIIAYDKEDQEKLFEEIRKHQDNNAYLAIWFMIETGLRCGELLALKWDDVDIDHCKLHVHATIVGLNNSHEAHYQNEPKSASSNRIIPLTAKALAILKLLRSRAKTEWVFENGDDRMSYKSLMYHTKRLTDICGIPYYGEHVFRHTFATNCYYKGVDIKILSMMMGHSDVKVTYNAYINLYGDGFDAMYAALCL